MSDYTLDNSAYERLQRENERLKAERDLAVRVAIEVQDERDIDWIEHWLNDIAPIGRTTAGAIKQVLAWYREAQNTEKGGE